MTNKSRNEPDSLRPSGRENGMVGAIWQGSANTLDTSAQERVRFLWTDLESGEKLVLEVQGDASFFRGLEELGFEREPQGPDGDETGECQNVRTTEVNAENIVGEDSVRCFPSERPLKAKLKTDPGAPRRSSRLLRRMGRVQSVGQDGQAPCQWNERRGA